MHALQFAHILPAITYGAGLEDHKSGFGTDSSTDPARSRSSIFTTSFSHPGVGNPRRFHFRPGLFLLKSSYFFFNHRRRRGEVIDDA